MTDLTERTERDQKNEAKRWDTIWWAGALIWIGLALAGEALEVLPDIGDSSGWWPWIFIGLGPWSLILNGYRFVSDALNPSTWDWVWTLLFLGVAIGTVADIAGEIVGAVVLVGIGAIILFRTLAQSD
mgnify:FL=1